MQHVVCSFPETYEGEERRGLFFAEDKLCYPETRGIEDRPLGVFSRGMNALFLSCRSIKRSDSNLIFLIAPTVKARLPEQNHFNLKLCGGLLLSNNSIIQSRGLQALQLQNVRIMRAFALTNWV